MTTPPTMPAAIYREPGRLDVDRVPVPEPGPDEVLIEVSHCGICGTDLHMIMEGWGQPDTIFGHEYSGRVAALGSGVEHWSVGQAVVAIPTTTCGECEFCRSDRPSLCLGRATPGIGGFQGAFAGYVRAATAQIVAVPAGLSLREAALTEPLAVALHAIGRVPIGPSSRVLISGLGPIGALALAALVARGHEQVTVVEPGERRAELARSLGAREVRHPADLEMPTIMDPGEVVDGAVDVVLECSGRRTAVESALGQLRRAGSLVLVGTGLEPPAFDINRILVNELHITGALEYDHDGFRQSLELLETGRLPTDLILHGVDTALPDMVETMQDLQAGQIPGKVLVCPALETDDSPTQQH